MKKIFFFFLCVISTGSDVSSEAELDADLLMVKTEPDLEKILLSEAFMNSALVMERVIVLNIFQPQLAAFRGLPVLKGELSQSVRRCVSTELKTEQTGISITNLFNGNAAISENKTHLFLTKSLRMKWLFFRIESHVFH